MDSDCREPSGPERICLIFSLFLLRVGNYFLPMFLQRKCTHKLSIYFIVKLSMTILPYLCFKTYLLTPL